MLHYFIHNGYSGWSYGTPSDPQLISVEDAKKIMKVAKLSQEQVAQIFPPAQYAEENDPLFNLTQRNRFICYGDLQTCMDRRQTKITIPLVIQWNELIKTSAETHEPSEIVDTNQNKIKAMELLAQYKGAYLIFENIDPITFTQIGLSETELYRQLISLESDQLVVKILERLDGPLFALSRLGREKMSHAGFVFDVDLVNKTKVFFADNGCRSINIL